MRTRRLIVATPEGERELLFIGRLTVGRAPECDISLADNKASRHHAEFDASGPVPRVTDLGSRNGILVNGRKVGTAELAPGDIVTVGDARIRFEEQGTTSTTATASTGSSDRTAVLSAMPPAPTPERLADVPPPSSAVPASAPHVAMAGLPNDDRTAVIPRQQAPAAPPPPPVAAADDRTMVLPRPTAFPKAAADRPEAAPPSATALDDLPLAPPPVAPVPVPASDAARVVPPAAPAPPAPVAAAPAPHAPAAPVAAGAPVAVVKGPRVSWGGLVTLTGVVLGGLAVLLGALPLMSVASSSIDALSRRQARTLAGWLAAGVDPQASPVVDPRVLEDVLAQTGVERAVVLDRATGRAIAPSSMSGQSFSALPGIGEGWRSVADPQVGVNDSFADAYVSAPGGGHVVWVRYQGASTSDAGYAVVVALVASLAFAILAGLLIKRHTRATLQLFTRQVELAVSGASSKVMQGTLMPGLERLPGVVTYLLEQRKVGAVMASGAAAPRGGVEGGAGGAAMPPPVVETGPPWLEVTPSLAVVDCSAHAPADGTMPWATARGKHLLDVLDSSALRNAVVQGLGALGMQPGAETTVPADGAGPVALRREPSGNVRVTLGTR